MTRQGSQVAPAGAMGGDVAFGAVLERDRLRRVQALPCPPSAPSLDRVYPVVPLAPGNQRPFAGVLKAIQRNWTKPHPVGLLTCIVAKGDDV